MDFDISGYKSLKYAKSIIESADHVHLPRSRGYLLRRSVTNGPDFSDAMGCYPFFCCCRWSGLGDDLESLDKEILCVSLITDPFGDFQANNLRDIFTDRFFLFKNHYVVNFSKNWKASIKKHHLRNIKKAAAAVETKRCPDTSALLADWCRLYRYLACRHNITGLTSFSEHLFKKLFLVPGIEAFSAKLNGETIGMLLCMVQDDIAYYHLGAYSRSGYEQRASYALFDHVMNHYAEKGFRYLGLGAGAGITDTRSDGLSWFKAGWANEQRPVYFCGKIFNKKLYFRLATLSGTFQSEYFPAYRTGEFDA